MAYFTIPKRQFSNINRHFVFGVLKDLKVIEALNYRLNRDKKSLNGYNLVLCSK